MRLLYKLERKIGHYAINNLMLVIIIGMAVVFVADLFFPDYNIVSYLTLMPSAVLRGQVWRLITFIFVPPASSPIFMIFALYFYYFIGSGLESAWGAFRFGAYYFIGVIATVLVGFITYAIAYAINPAIAVYFGIGNTYLNLSLFLAFAILYPDLQLLLFFFIPIKVKWLAIADAVLLGVMLIINAVAGNWMGIASILAALVNLMLFFGGSLINRLRNWWSYRKTRRNFRNQMRR